MQYFLPIPHYLTPFEYIHILPSQASGQIAASLVASRSLLYRLMAPALEDISVNQSINQFKVQSHHGNGLRTLLDNNINTSIKQSDTDITEWTEKVRKTTSYSKN